MDKQLQDYLYQHIPLSKAMGIQVKMAHQDRVILKAPFYENINHKKTVFGGSLHAVCTLACWSLVHLNVKQAQIVITKSEIDYLAPVDADFEAIAVKPAEGEWQRFLKMLSQKGKGRINLTATITHKGRLCVHYKATFAALPQKEKVQNDL